MQRGRLPRSLKCLTAKYPPFLSLMSIHCATVSMLDALYSEIPSTEEVNRFCTSHDAVRLYNNLLPLDDSASCPLI